MAKQGALISFCLQDIKLGLPELTIYCEPFFRRELLTLSCDHVDGEDRTIHFGCDEGRLWWIRMCRIVEICDFVLRIKLIVQLFPVGLICVWNNNEF